MSENMALEELVSARIHVIYSKGSRSAVILRQGPSKQILTIGWNLEDDSFKKGQWLKGKIYPTKCDISADGKHWVYFAYQKDPYTVVAKVPYLKALYYHPDTTTYFGGGYFNNDKHVSLSVDPRSLEVIRKGNLKITSFRETTLINTSILEGYLVRNAWIATNIKIWNEGSVFQQSILGKRRLQLTVENTKRSDGSNKIFSYELWHTEYNSTIDPSRWEWADYDAFNQRMIWAEMGKIMTANLVQKDHDVILKNPKCLLDTNDMVFEELIAPY